MELVQWISLGVIVVVLGAGALTVAVLIFGLLERVLLRRLPWWRRRESPALIDNIQAASEIAEAAEMFDRHRQEGMQCCVVTWVTASGVLAVHYAGLTALESIGLLEGAKSTIAEQHLSDDSE